MTRFIQNDNRVQPVKPAKEVKRELPKAGKYTRDDLYGAKKLITPNGGKR